MTMSDDRIGSILREVETLTKEQQRQLLSWLKKNYRDQS